MAFRAPGADEFTETKFTPAAADTYRCVIDHYEIVEGFTNQYNKDGHATARFFLAPIAIEGDEEALMVDTNDEELPEDKYFIFFFDPAHLGTKPVVSKGRKFLANALQIDYEQPVEAETLEAFCDSLVNKEIIADIGVKVGAKGPVNTVLDTRQVKVRKPRRQRVDKGDLTEQAAEVFNEEDTSNEDDF